MKIIIAGGGIAGLTAAISIKKYCPQHEVEIYESSPELKAVGAGLGMSANAILAFEELGIKDRILNRAKVLERLCIYNKKGRLITQTNNLAVNREYNTISSFAMHRADLQDVLKESIGEIPLFTGKKIISFKEEEREVRLNFDDGSFATADFVIAADGIHSVFRRELQPDSKIRYAGYTCWRGGISQVPEGMNTMVASETWSGGKRFGIVPLSNNRVYWFACINASKPKDPVFAVYTREDLLQAFKGFHYPVPEILTMTEPSNIIWNDIIDFAPISRFAFSRILLLGDAAHATTPNMGQGACQAIEGAVILGKMLKDQTDIKEVFARFEKRRLKRTRFIVKQSWRIGKLAQLDNRWLEKLRDMVFGLIPEKVSKKQIEQVINVNFDT